MKKILTAGVVLGLSVAVWYFIYGFAGLYKNLFGGFVFIGVAILIQVGVLVWGLRQTASDGRRYGGQFLAGLLICLIAGILTVFASFAFIAAFPDVMDITAELTADSWSQQGMSDELIETRMEQTAFTRTAWFQALTSFIGSMVSGVIITLIVAAFVRKKD